MDLARSPAGKLQELTDLMVEKELRLRTPLEELDLLRQSAGITEAKQDMDEQMEEEEG